MRIDLRAALSALAGAAIGGRLLGWIGEHTDRAMFLGGYEASGCAAGTVLGGIVGLGAVRGWIGGPVVGGALGSALGCVLGPGVDDTQGVCGAILGAIGAAVGLAGVRAIVAIVAGALASILFSRVTSAAFPDRVTGMADQWDLFGQVIGCVVALGVVSGGWRNRRPAFHAAGAGLASPGTRSESPVP